MITNQTEANFNNEQYWKLDDNEYAYIMCGGERIDARENPKAVYIPTLQSSPDKQAYSLIPTVFKETLSENLFCNDKDCMPVVAPVISRPNYIQVFHNHNDWFMHRWINRGATIRLDVHNGDIDSIRISDKIDPSYCDDCATDHPTCPHEGIKIYEYDMGG